MNFYVRKSVADNILKSIQDGKLEYFKREIIKILEKQNDITKSFSFQLFMIEKSGLGVGHVSIYKDGSAWKKIQNNPPKWKCVRQTTTYNSESAGAKQSITKLINKVKDCKTTDELLDIVMFNINRFRDDNGNILPIVEKLKKEVNNKKNVVNIKEPSTQQKIEEFYARKKYAESEFEIGNEITDKELKDILSSVKHLQSRKDYINDYYLSRLNSYEKKELVDSNGVKADVTVFKNKKIKQDEINAAVFFQRKGCNVVILDESQRKTDEKHPDLLVNGVVVEVKTCRDSNANGIATEIKHAINKRSAEIPSIFLLNNSAKVDFDEIIEKLELKKKYLVADVDAIFLINNEVITLIDKKNTEGSIKGVPSASSNISQLKDLSSKKDNSFNTIEDVKKAYQGTDKWLKAPNGKDSKLDEKQWCQVRTQDFKNWFGDWENNPNNASKIVDENGEPMICYHGTKRDFDTFDKDKINERKDGVKGFYFSTEKRKGMLADSYAGEKGNVLSVYLNIRNPKIKNANSPDFDFTNNDGIISLLDIESTDRYYDYKENKLKEVKLDKGDIVEIVAFNPNQIKSAVNNDGKFDLNNNNINKSFSLKVRNILEGKAV